MAARGAGSLHTPGAITTTMRRFASPTPSSTPLLVDAPAEDRFANFDDDAFMPTGRSTGKRCDGRAGSRAHPVGHQGQQRRQRTVSAARHVSARSVCGVVIVARAQHRQIVDVTTSPTQGQGRSWWLA